jgi:hypothetical protein
MHIEMSLKEQDSTSAYQILSILLRKLNKLSFEYTFWEISYEISTYTETSVVQTN